MKKFLAVAFAFLITTISANAATWVAADRVSVVGKKILEKNDLPQTTTFKVVNGVADNSDVSTTNIIYISSTDLSYTGNDSEVAAVVANEIGHIINGKASKDKLRNMAKAAITSNLSKDSKLMDVANSEYLASKTSLSDNKEADITGADLLIKAGYNPLAGIVVITKMPGSTLEILQGKPQNAERAMYLYDYLTYNFPSKVKAGYNCREYRSFLTYADPIVQKRNKSKSKLAKFNKEQEKAKQLRARRVAQYQAVGISGWDSSYIILKSLTESTESK